MLFCALIALSFSTTALALDPHVEAVIRIVEGAKGKVAKTEDGQSLKLVDLPLRSGRMTLAPEQALTVESLRGVTLDD